MSKKRAYAYLRVSTFTQVEGKSLEGQLKEIQTYCQAYDIEIVDIYSDEGKSGKSIEGRPQFKQLLKDVEEKEDVDYVIVWKLSRFGRNARETLNAIEFLQKHKCNLISKEERLDSSDKNGKFTITLLSALAEMERENIMEQTLNGKKYNALSGNWNGGRAPFGYSLVDRQLVINEEEAKIVKLIYDWYVNDGIGYNGITAKLNEMKISPRKQPRLDRRAMEKSGSDEKIYLKTVDYWCTSSVKDIITHPVYCGKIRWGNSRTISENGITKRVYKEDAIISDGRHEAIISEELFQKAQQCFENRTEKFRNRKPANQSPKNILNQIARCPQCGSGMVACSSQYKTVKGENRYYYNYICGYYNNHKGGSCKKNAIKADLLEGAVLETIKKYLQRPNIVQEITDCLTAQFDTTKLKQEIERLESQVNVIKENENRQYNIMNQIGLEGKYQNWDFEKVEKNLDALITNRKSKELQIQEKKAALEVAEAETMDAEAIKFVLEHFEEAFQHSSKEQQKLLLQSILQEVQLEKREIDGKLKVLPKSLTLKVTGEQINMVKENLGLKEDTVETVCLLSRKDFNDSL